MQQRLVSPVIQRGGRFVEGRAWSQEAVKMANPLDSAHSLPTGWQRHLRKRVGQMGFCCLGWVSGQVYRVRGGSEGRRLCNKKIIKERAQTASCYW